MRGRIRRISGTVLSFWLICTFEVLGQQLQEKYSIEVELKYQFNDAFSLYYLGEETKSADFHSEFKLTRSVEAGKIINQHFALPEKLSLNRFRLDFGHQRENQIVLRKVILHHADRKFTIGPADFEDFFVLNPHLRLDSVTASAVYLTSLELRGDYDPFIVFVGDIRRILDLADPPRESEDCTLKLALSIKMQKPEELYLYYRETLSQIFSEERKIWKPVSGGDDYQQVNFCFSGEEIRQIRLDLGSFSENTIVLKSLVLDNGDLQVRIRGEDFLRFFIVNDFLELITWGSDSVVFKTKRIQSGLDPYMVMVQDLQFFFEQQQRRIDQIQNTFDALYDSSFWSVSTDFPLDSTRYLSMNVSLKDKDIIQVYFDDENVSNNAVVENLSAIKFVMPDSGYQEIYFPLPAGMNPRAIRIDPSSLGENKISIREITLRHDDFTKRWDAQDIMQYFNFNSYVKPDFTDGETLVLNTHEVEGHYDPFFINYSIYRPLEIIGMILLTAIFYIATVAYFRYLKAFDPS